MKVLLPKSYYHLSSSILTLTLLLLMTSSVEARHKQTLIEAIADSNTNNYNITTSSYSPFYYACANVTNLGWINGKKAEFTVYGNDYILNGTNRHGYKSGGFIVDRKQTLNLNDISDIKNFSFGAYNTSKGTININNSSFSNNSYFDIFNLGTVNINQGVTNFTQGIVDHNMIGNVGTININNGAIVSFGSTGDLYQDTLNIANGGSLQINADKLQVNKLSNEGILSFTGGVNNLNISGSGQLKITGNVENLSDSKVENRIFVTSTGSFSGDIKNFTSSADMTNNGNLYLYGSNCSSASALLNSGINGYGNTNIYGYAKLQMGDEITTSLKIDDGQLDNAGIISGALVIGNNGKIYNSNIIKGFIENNGTLVSHAGGLLGQGSIINNSVISLLGGNNDSNREKLQRNITGTGTINISGYVYNDYTISNRVNVNSAANFINEGIIKGNLVNNATTTTNTSFITGSITNNRTLNVIDMVDKNITGSGTVVLGSDEVYFTNDIQISGILNLNGKLLSLQDVNSSNSADYNEITIGKLVGKGDLALDANLNTANKNIDSLSIGGGDAIVNLVSVNITADGDATNFEYLKNATNDITALINGAEKGSLTTYTEDFKYIFTLNDNGLLEISKSTPAVNTNLSKFLSGELDSTVNTLSLGTHDISVNTADIGTTTNPYFTTLNINLNNGIDLTGTSSNQYNGITIAENYKLNLKGSKGSDSKVSVISGFNTALINEVGGILNLSNFTFENNTLDIANDGTLTLDNQNSFTTGIKGNGNTVIIGGNTTVTGKIEQNSLNIKNGTLTINANDLVLANDLISNAGSLVLSGGTLAHNISGIGSISIIDDVINSKNISQSLILISNNKTLTNNSEVKAGIDLVSTGKIIGTGILNLNDDSKSAGNITQSQVIIADGYDFINTGTLNTALDNQGTITSTGNIALTGNSTTSGNIENNITVNSGVNFAIEAGTKQLGSITNQGVIDFNTDFTIKNNIINATGITNINADVITEQYITQKEININENSSLNYINSGTNSTDIAGAGTLIINDEFTNTTGTSISSGVLINSSGLLNITASDLTPLNASLTNTGKVNLTGGSSSSQELKTSFLGTGILNIASGEVNNENYNIRNAVAIASGATFSNNGGVIYGDINNEGTLKLKLSTLASDSKLENNSSLKLLGGATSNETQALTRNITGNSTNNTYISSGYISSDMNIAQNVVVENSSNFSNTGKILGNLTNESGSITTTDTANISGAINNAGTLNVIDSINKDILGSGTTVLSSDTVYFSDSVEIAGVLDINGKTINLQESGPTYSYSAREISEITGSGSLMIDVDMTTVGNNVTGKATSSDKLKVNGGTATIDLSAINITSDGTNYLGASDDGYADYFTYIDNAGANLTLTLGGSTTEPMSTYTSSKVYKFTLGSNGKINVDINNSDKTLSDFVKGTISSNATLFSINNDITGQDIGTTNRNSGATTLNIALNNGADLKGFENNNAYEGITVASDYTLNVQGSKGNSTNGDAKIFDFNTAFTNEVNGTLKIKDIIFENNTLDIANNGALILSGENSFVSGIKGNGSLKIIDGETIISDTGKVSQESLTIANGAIFKINSDNLITSQIENSGTLDFTSGSTISQAISGEGTLILNSDIASNVAIEQNEIELNGNIEFTNNNTLKAGINIAAGQAVIGNGSITLLKDSQNSGTLFQQAMTVESGVTFTNSNASNLNIINGINNMGQLIFTNNNTKITGLGSMTLSGINTETINQKQLTTNGDLVNESVITSAVTNTHNISGSGNLILNGNSTNTGSITQNQISISKGVTLSGTNGAITGEIINKGIINMDGNSSVTVLGDSQNTGTINSAITLGEGTTQAKLLNTGTIYDLTVKSNSILTNQGYIKGSTEINAGGIAISTASNIGNITNNGNLELTEGVLKSSITGSGTTSITGDVTLTNSATLSNTNITETGILNVGTNKLDLSGGDLNIDGVLRLEISSLTPNSSIYEGGQVISSGDLTLNPNTAKLELTIEANQMANDERTGELELLNISGNINGKFYELLSNNRYYIESVLDSNGNSTGRYIIEYEADIEDIVLQGGGNNNHTSTGVAWDNLKGTTGDGEVVRKELNRLSQNDTEGYVKALDKIAPSDSQKVVQTVGDVNRLIQQQVSRRQTGIGQSSGDTQVKAGMWAYAIANYSKQDNTANNAGFRGKTSGMSLGIDREFGDKISAGIGYSYSHTSVDERNEDTDLNSNSFFLYGKYSENNWYSRGYFSYGFSSYKETSDISGIGIYADYDVHDINLHANIGYDMKNGFIPEVGLRYTYIVQEKYSDSIGQQIKANDIDILTGVAMLNYGRDFKVENSGLVIRPSFAIGVTYDMLTSRNIMNISVGNSNYTIFGDEKERISFETNLGLETIINDWTLSASYALSFRRDYQSHTGMLKVRYDF